MNSFNYVFEGWRIRVNEFSGHCEKLDPTNCNHNREICWRESSRYSKGHTLDGPICPSTPLSMTKTDFSHPKAPIDEKRPDRQYQAPQSVGQSFISSPHRDLS